MISPNSEQTSTNGNPDHRVALEVLQAAADHPASDEVLFGCVISAAKRGISATSISSAVRRPVTLIETIIAPPEITSTSTRDLILYGQPAPGRESER